MSRVDVFDYFNSIAWYADVVHGSEKLIMGAHVEGGAEVQVSEEYVLFHVMCVFKGVD